MCASILNLAELFTGLLALFAAAGLARRWAYAHLPELQLFGDDRREVLQKLWMRRQVLCAGIVLLGGGVVCGEFLAHLVLRWTPHVPASLLYAPLAFIAFLLMLVVPILMNMKSIQKALRCELRRRGTPICLHCGYLLHGIGGELCPECGRRVDAAQEPP